MSLLENRWQLYVGIMTESTVTKNQRWFHIFVPEFLPTKTGDVSPEGANHTVKIENVLTNKTEELDYNITSTIYADYFGFNTGLDVPTMYRNMQVLVFNYAATDKWYWLPLERDDSYKTFEHYRISCADEAVTNKKKVSQNTISGQSTQSWLKNVMSGITESIPSLSNATANNDTSGVASLLDSLLQDTGVSPTEIDKYMSEHDVNVYVAIRKLYVKQYAADGGKKTWVYGPGSIQDTLNEHVSKMMDIWVNYQKSKNKSYDGISSSNARMNLDNDMALVSDINDAVEEYEKQQKSPESSIGNMLNDVIDKAEDLIDTTMSRTSAWLDNMLGRTNNDNTSDTTEESDAGIEKDNIEERDATLTDDNTYYIEIDTKYRKHIKISTASTDGEEFRYFIEIDANAHSIELWDVCVDGSQPNNTIKIESRPDPETLGRITLQNASNNSIIMSGEDTEIYVPRNLVVNVGGDTQFMCAGNVNSHIMQDFTSIVDNNESTTTTGATNHTYVGDSQESYMSNKEVTVAAMYKETETTKLHITHSSASWAIKGPLTINTEILNLIVAKTATFAINMFDWTINTFTAAVNGTTTFNTQTFILNMKEWLANAEKVAGSAIELIRKHPCPH